MQIRDIEVKTGLDRATIRFYEKEGLIRPSGKKMATVSTWKRTAER